MKTATLGIYSVDPNALDAFHAFGPEAYAVLPAIVDSLVTIGLDGSVVPCLATRWEQTGPVTLEMTLREGVRFHNGEVFDADSVVANLEAHTHPTPSPNSGMLQSIERIEALGPYRIRIHTRFPDAMLLRRLFFFPIHPKGVLAQPGGRDALFERPIGTGAWRFVHWKKGEEIVLERNPDHWAGRSSVDRVRIPIVRQKEWVSRLARGEFDAILNLDAHDVVRCSRIDGLEVESREAALSQWFLLANKGPLEDVQVRRALNHAIKRSLIAELSEHGLASPQHSIATTEAFGHADDVSPYRYSPSLARRLLAEAGYADGFTLRGLVSESSTSVYFAVREFLSRVGVRLEAEIVPRSTWMGRIVGGNVTGNPYDGDFALSVIDNPILDSIFPHAIMMFSQGMASIRRDEAYDAEFMKAATTVGEGGLAARQSLERYAVDEALILFTVKQQVHAAWRTGCSIPLPRSGLFTGPFWWEFDTSTATSTAIIQTPAVPSSSARALVDGTSYTGTFFLPEDHRFEEGWAAHVWEQLQVSEERWRLGNEPMIKELVTQIEARNDLSSILSSTRRAAIVGYSPEGELRFKNSGYSNMFGDEVEHIGAAMRSPTWASIAREVEKEGSWLGPVQLETSRLPAGTPAQLYLTATTSHDDEGAMTGFTLVFSDFSGEEERIKNQAIRAILDNVPYGLFTVGADAVLRPGISESCKALFPNTDELVGARLTELIGLDERDGFGLELAIGQAFEDWLPEEVSLAQIPARVQDARGRTLSLSASIIRDPAGAVDGLLFTVDDITQLIEAEREVEAMRGTVKVIRFRDRFESYVKEFAENLQRLEDTVGSTGWEQLARRELHTAKGVFGQFGVEALYRKIHVLEDVETVGVRQLREARAALEQVLAAHADVWNIQLGRSDERFEVAGETLQSYERRVQAAQSLDEARQLVGELMEHVRCKPASSLLGPLEEDVVRLAARHDKKVRVELQGGELRIPARLAPVFDQLGHLVRNAVDHGIEQADERGHKPAKATLTVAVARRSDGWRLTVADDGKGIDPERIANKAISMGVVAAGDVATMSRADKLALLFVDGLSTADTVSETSGRGVGMSAVRSAAERVGGRVFVHSALGEGTRFELSIPDFAQAGENSEAVVATDAETAAA